MVAAAMPMLRASMCERLIDNGDLADACEILLGSLKDDPGDAELNRIRAVDLTLQLGWDDELSEIIDAFQDDQFGPIPYARAILDFKLGGASRRADALLRDANELRPGVAAILTGRARVDFDDDQRYEESVIGQCLLPGVRQTPGAVAWIRDTLNVSAGDDDDEAQRIAAQDAQRFAIELPPSVDHWYLVIKKTNNTFFALIISENGLVSAEPFPKRPKADQLRELLIQAVSAPLQGGPMKPQSLLVATKADFNSLNKYAGTIGIECRQEKPPRELTQAVEPMLAAASRELARKGEPDSAAPDPGDVNELPLSDETWLFSVFQPPMWISDRATPWRAWMQLLLRASDGVILKTESVDQKPSADRIGATIRSAMSDPLVDSPRRPRELFIDPKAFLTSDTELAPEKLLEQLPPIDQMGDVAAEVGDDRLSDFFDQVVSELLTYQGPTDKPLFFQDGVDADFLRQVYETASRFYRSAPWKMVPGDALFDIRCDAWEVPAWTGCVMGQLGQELGMALYDQPADARRFIETEDPSLINSVVVHFGEAFDTIPVDLWFLERHGWPVASNEAYPFVTRISHGRDIMCPSAADLHVLCEVMKHTLRFLDHPKDRPLCVDNGSGEMIEFQWV